MHAGERRAHAVQVARSAAALARAGADVTLTIRRDHGRGDAAGVPVAAEMAAAPVRDRTAAVPEAASAPLAEAAAAGVRVVPIRWRSGARWPLEWALARERVGSAGAGASASRPVVFVREVAPYAVTLARAAGRWGLPLVYEAHNLKCVVTEEERGRDAAREAEALEREIFERASGVVFTAPLTEGLARERFGFRAPALVAPNGAPPVFEPGPHGGPPRDIEILYAGQLYRWKGFDLLLQAMAQLPGRRLTVAGGGAGEELQLARARAAEMGVADRVEFLGQLPPAEALSLMRRARVGVIPLPSEGSAEARWFTAPLKLFELWASGAPVVVTDLPSLRALVRDGETAVVAPAEPAGLAAAVNRILNDPTLAARLAAGGRSEAATRSWDARARGLLAFFAAVQGGRKSVAGSP